MYKTSFLTLLLLTSVFVMPVFTQEAERGAYPARIKGLPGATVTLEVFNDYACPACADFNLRLKEIERKFPNDLKIIFRHFPLKIAGHEQAPLAAQAVEAAGLQWKFWEMADLILEKQKLWTISASAKVDFFRYAKNLGLDVGIFRADMESKFVKKE